jgi:hypothetical protein
MAPQLRETLLKLQAIGGHMRGSKRQLRWGPFAVIFLAAQLGACNCGAHTGAAGDGGHDGGSTGASTGASGGGCGLRTCASAKANCGPIGDGCGDIIQCGTCPGSQDCGAGGPNVCGTGGATGGGSGGGSGGGTGAACTNLCLQQQSCGAGKTTSVTGTVFAATNPTNGFGNPDPLPNALVYVPNGPLEPFPDSVTCDPCGAPASGSPLVSTVSSADGGFELDDVPVGTDIPLVVQIGRWRREVSIDTSGAPCANTVLTPDQTRMPRNHTEGDIPRIAMVTGNVDALECVLRKMGIDDQEFTAPGVPDAGRVQIYVADDGKGNLGASDATGTAPPESTLTSSPATLGQYDMVLFACVGAQVNQNAADQQNVIEYANDGGRIYATHYSYVWLDDDAPFSTTADWAVAGEQQQNATEQVDVNTAFARGALLSDWLEIVGASTTPGVIPLAYLRNDFTASNAPSETWLTWDTGGGGGNGGNGGGADWPIHYTFDTPVGAPAADQCGRVVFSDFHVENASTNGTDFPNECLPDVPMTPQEKVLEFMLFDLSSCVLTSTPGGGTCVPQTCAQLGYNCGLAGDGCGNVINCTAGGASCFEGGNCGCADGGICGGAGQGNVCGVPTGGFE